MNDKKLLFVINDLSFFFSHRLPLAKAASEAGYVIHIAAPKHMDVPKLTQLGYTFHAIPMGRKSVNPINEMKSLFSLIRLYRSIKPALIHHFSIKPNLYGSIAAKFSRKPPVINTVTGLGYVYISNKLSARILRAITSLGFKWAYRGKNLKVIFQNSDDQSQFVSQGLVEETASELIRGSGIPLSDYPLLPWPDTSTLMVLLPARLLWDKGIGEFVAAASLLKQKNVSVRLVLAGKMDSGNPSAISEKQLETWVDQGLIDYWGYFSDIREAFSRAHIVCLPSYREGLPRVLLEASACGRPIITTDVPGCRDVVSRENGILIKPQSVTEIACAIEDLVHQRDALPGMGLHGREMVENRFASQIINEQTLAVYDSLS